MTKRVIALGTFDGVHLGHRQILDKMLEIADIRGYEPLIYTFSNHPLAAFGKAPKLVMKDGERLALLKEFAPVEAVPFDREYAAISPEEFAQQLATKYDAATVVAGFNYTFGSKGAGNMQCMREFGEKLGFEVVEVPPFVQDGMPVSSSRIRACVESGDMEQANAMLGRAFEIWATAEEQGTTVQVTTDETQICPANGLYRAVCEDGTEGTLEINGEKMLFSSEKETVAERCLKLALQGKII